MLGLIIFVASFLSLSVISFIFTDVPPGSLIIYFFRNSEANIQIAGLSGNILISALINGIFWSVIITLVYLFWRGPDKEKTNIPVWVPGYAKSRNSKD
jgi:hypothetical protein